MASKKNNAQNNNPTPDTSHNFGSTVLVRNPWTQLTVVIISLITIFIFGFGAGEYSQKTDAKIEKLEMERQCSEKVQAEINHCREEKLAEYGKSVEDIKAVVKELQDKK